MAGPQSFDREQVYQEQYRRFMQMEVPPCTRCGTSNTASVQVGVVGITIRLAATCSKFKLIANGPKPGDWFCNSCNRFFDVPYEGNEGASI
jgi:hypothetical protein